LHSPFRIPMPAQVLVPIFLIVSVVASLDLLARNEKLTGRLTGLAKNKTLSFKRKTIFQNHGYFLDFEDQLVLEELRRADYRRGGVYLIGSSDVKWATALWELPPSQRRFIHNYAIGATTHTAQWQVLRYLVEEEGLLRAGGAKTCVILGVSYLSIAHDMRTNSFFYSLWSRHGLYQASPECGIRRVRNSAVCFCYVERLRIGAFLAAIRKRVVRPFERLLYGYVEPPPSEAPRIHNPSEYCRMRREGMGLNWQVKLREQTEQFGIVLDYLLDRNVHVLVILMPRGSWESNLPYQGAYTNAIAAACQQRRVGCLDWSGLLEDEEFADANHANSFGINKFQSALLSIALPFLREARTIP